MPTMILCRVSTALDHRKRSWSILLSFPSWFKSPGLSNNPFSPLNTLIYERFPNNPFLLLNMNIRLWEWDFDSCFVQVFFTLDDQLFLHGPEVFVGGRDADREINGTIS